MWLFAYAAIERVPGGLERLVRTLGFAAAVFVFAWLAEGGAPAPPWP